MKNLSIAAVALSVVLLVPASGWAHEGHPHKVMGTVSAVSANSFEMKTPEGKVVTVSLTPKTTDVKVGERVVIEVPSEKEMIAATVTMAAPTPTVAKK
jgi:hypothetical protein